MQYLEASVYIGMILHQPDCSNDVLIALASKAVDDNVFGPTSGWTPAIVGIIETLINKEYLFLKRLH